MVHASMATIAIYDEHDDCGPDGGSGWTFEAGLCERGFELR